MGNFWNFPSFLSFCSLSMNQQHGRLFKTEREETVCCPKQTTNTDCVHRFRHPSYRFSSCLSSQETGGMRRSLKLIVDTSKLIGNSVILHQPNIDINQIASSFPSTSTNDEDRRRILKDSSKDDFSSSYNPKIIQKYNKNEGEEVRVNEIHRSRLTTTTSTLLSMEFTSETIILAMVGAFILFLIVVIGVMLSTAHAARTQLKSVGTSTTGSRRNLVTHEILPNSDVQPIRI